MTPPLLIVAIGNEARGDDALAPVLLRRLETWVYQLGLQDKIELLEDFQLQVEHAVDLLERDLVLFLDAGADTPSPYRISRISPCSSRALFSHALTPEDVLATYVQVYRQSPPPCFMLCIAGVEFELGTPLSSHAARNLEAAHRFAHELLQTPELAAWERLISLTNISEATSADTR